MDWGKDFIHIDKVFGRLKDNEEQNRGEGWLQMKNLLDKQMPVGGAMRSGSSVRRYIVPLLSLLMLAGGAATYYALKEERHSLPDKQKIAASTVLASKGVPAYSSSGSKTPGAEDRSYRSKTGLKESQYPKRQNSSENKGFAEQPAALTSGAALSARTNRRTATEKQVAVKALPVPQYAASSPPESTGHLSSASGHKTTQELPAAAGKAIIPDTQGATAGGPGARSLSGKLQKERTTRKNEETNGERSGSHSKVAEDKSADRVYVALGNKRIVRDEAGNLYKEEWDTLKRIEVVERYKPSSAIAKNRLVKVQDTIAVTRVEKVRYVPLSSMELLTLEKLQKSGSGNLVPMAKMTERNLTTEWSNLVPLERYKVSTRKVDPKKLNDLVRYTTSGLANYFDGSRKLYAALLVGGNTVIGNPGAWGMQAGLAALYSLSERITLSAEVRVTSHYWNNYTIDDYSVQYNGVVAKEAGNQWLFSGEEQTITSSYKVNSFYTLSLPLTISYNFGRISTFGGIQIERAFPMNWQKQTAVAINRVERSGSFTNMPFANVPGGFDEKREFLPRWGVGYVAGVSYDFSKNVSIDARLVQVLADNAKGNSDAVSRLFRMPGLQLSLSYFLGRREKVVYIMDRK